MVESFAWRNFRKNSKYYAIKKSKEKLRSISNMLIGLDHECFGLYFVDSFNYIAFFESKLLVCQHSQKKDILFKDIQNVSLPEDVKNHHEKVLRLNVSGGRFVSITIMQPNQLIVNPDQILETHDIFDMYQFLSKVVKWHIDKMKKY